MNENPVSYLILLIVFVVLGVYMLCKYAPKNTETEHYISSKIKSEYKI